MEDVRGFDFDFVDTTFVFCCRRFVFLTLKRPLLIAETTMINCLLLELRWPDLDRIDDSEAAPGPQGSNLKCRTTY